MAKPGNPNWVSEKPNNPTLAEQGFDKNLADATRRIGELMAELKAADKMAKGGQPHQSTGLSKNPVEPTLAEQGIDKNLAKAARKLAAMPDRCRTGRRKAICNPSVTPALPHPKAMQRSQRLNPS